MNQQIKVYAKAVGVFVLGVIVNMITNLINGGVPWPQTGAEWVQFLGTSFGAAIVALVVPNKITQKQLDKDPAVPPGVVLLPATPPTAAGEYKNPWQ